MKKNYYFQQNAVLATILFLFFINSGLAQTTVISPTGDGGFETGTTFSANGWTVDSPGGTANQWVCNTGAMLGFSGARAAYISNTATSAVPTHTYTVTAPTTSHLYRNVTIPAGQTQISLNFLWRGRGESIYDYMRVWLSPTTYTPAVGTQIAGSGTAPTGVVQAGLNYYNLQASWVNAAAITIPAAYAGTTFRLIFEWTNDISAGTQPPSGIDNISLVSQAPVVLVNDNCTSATPLTPGPSCVTTSGTTVGATQSISSILCSGFTGTADDDVWYSFVASASSQTITVNAGFDSVIDLRSGACNGTTIFCADSNTGTGVETIAATGLTVGATYYVRVYSYANATYGNFTICITAPATVPNDNCSGAVALTVNPTTACSATTAGTTVGATQSQAACTALPTGSDDDVWYKFTAAGSTHTVAVTPGTLNDAVLEVFSGSCTGLTSFGCVDSTVGANVEATTLTGLTSGSIYFVRVHSYNAAAGSQGTFSLCVSTPGAATFNDCIGAIGLSVSPTATCTTSASGTTVGATQSQPACSGIAGGSDDDVWYRFVATASNQTVTVTPGTLADVVFQVFSGSCGALANLACIDNTTASAIETTTLSGLTTGDTYYIRIHSYNANVGSQGTFSVCVTTPPIATNDNCPGAIALTVNPTSACTVDTSGTTVGMTQSLAGCSGTADDDAWYSFTPTATSHVITATPGTLYDIVFQVFSGSCTGLTNVACVDATFGTSVESTTLTGLTVGVPYYIRIHSYYNIAADAGTFTLCVTTPMPPVNDNCAGATSLTVNSTVSCTSSTAGTTVSATQSQVGCAGTADDDVWYTFTAVGTSHTVTVTPATLSNAVFQVFSGTCTALTSIACINATAGTASEATTLTGLTPGATYIVRVYSFAATGQGTFTICVTTGTTCTLGSGTGTTSLACPSVVSGGLGLNGLDPATIDCTTSGCVDLQATYLQVGQTTSYNVESIPYVPPYQFGCLANPVSVNIDDVWSPVITLPFNFCFYGNIYNQCLISSNGAITFDTASYAPGGFSAWQILYNLPNANLFKNAIFGVYNDIDPSKGGTVGYELITLNTGCRALVASWNNIPMFRNLTGFNCNTLLYTGMIVLYENTNIIEVYIKEKNICPNWNDGNAIVGVQNATATLSTIAPGRNGLDTDWTVTNEAWRFVPSGTAITSVKWHEGVGTGGPVIGTTDVISVCPSVTTTYTAEVTYTLCTGTTLVESESTTATVNKGKTWNGSAGTDWNTAANWTPAGVPTAVNCVIIPDVTNDPIISGSGYNAYGYSLDVLNGGNLTLQSNNNITVTNEVTVSTGGVFDIRDSASLLQVNNVANIGNIKMQRITKPMYLFDYTYWGSPVTQASNFTLGALSPGTQPDKYYSWTPYIGASFGTWNQESAATVMNPQKGYIVRAPNSFSSNSAVKVPYTGTFTGTPNNGIINSPVLYGTFAGNNDQYNLLGNPYPSAVSAASFLNFAANTNIVDGTIYFWTHNSPPSTAFPDPFYNDFVTNYSAQDYASWNKVGGVGTMALSGGTVPNGYIAAGQAFFVRSMGTTPGSATFNNSMRVAGNNNQFFRYSNDTHQNEPAENDDNFEKHRLWLNLTNETGAFNQILVAYAEGATHGWDRGYDGMRFNNLNNITFYSIIPEHILVIQGRALPFDVSDQVPLGYVSTLSGTFSIRIDHFDGLFEGQDVYIEDKLLNIIHDIKQSPYLFTTETGSFNERFVLRYTNSTLSVNEMHSNTALAFINDKKLFASASADIESITVYEMNGKLIKSYKPLGSKRIFEGDFIFAQGIYFAKIRLQNDTVVTAKLRND